MNERSEGLTPKGDIATIQTATVDVRVIRIGNRQLTQSVFRQLPEKKLSEDGLTLPENMWGRVIYDFGNYSDNGFHVVFQENGELFRCYCSGERWGASGLCAAIDKNYCEDSKNSEALKNVEKRIVKVADNIIMTTLVLEAIGETNTKYEIEIWEGNDNLIEVKMLNVFSYKKNRNDYLWIAWNDQLYHQENSIYMYDLFYNSEDAINKINTNKIKQNATELERIIKEEIDEINRLFGLKASLSLRLKGLKEQAIALQARYEENKATIKALPQLFIAT